MLTLKSILFLKMSQKSIYLVIEMRNIICVLRVYKSEDILWHSLIEFPTKPLWIDQN